MRARVAGRLAAACSLALSLGMGVVPAASPGVVLVSPESDGGPLPGPYVTLLFSRTEITAAVNCALNDTGVARLDTEVAPYLASMGMTATGTLVTSKIKDSALTCTHSKGSLMGSWADATSLSTTYGWSFVSHTATYPANIGSLDLARKYSETCGSALAIDAHGLPGGHGLIAYPGAQALPVELQTSYSANCFAWGRTYNPKATTSIEAGTTPPYWQVTAAPNGGPCNLSTAACYRYEAVGSKRYVLPIRSINSVNALVPGKWMTMQSYLLVTGTNPPGSSITWDCTAADPMLHWTSDNERYCEDDWKRVIRAIKARSDVIVTDPLTVGVAFGRPAGY